jgi:hypothetical protein
MCNVTIVADIKIDYQTPCVIIMIDGEEIAKIITKKWNELREMGKIKFASELA